MKKSPRSISTKTVVVHRGARDGYEVARALAEADMLERLVTDVYWPRDRAAARATERILPASLRQSLRARWSPGIPAARVSTTLPSGPASFVIEKTRRFSFEQRRRAQRWNDAALGTLASNIARSTASQLLSYSYYGYHAFSAYGRPGLLFQVHPHPASVRRLLARELAEHPDCASSLQKEWELSLPAEDFARLRAESDMASDFLCASSFTRQTLIENGAPADRISVIPYGVDTNRFFPLHPAENQGGRRKKFQMLFVGTINQRKGIKYLLEALRLLGSRHLELVVCGRVVDNLPLFSGLGDTVQVRPSVSFADLRRCYQEADLFVFPSVVEGFAQVLLEALGSGLPILSTTHTAAPDLIEDGIQGYIVEPRRPDLLAEKIAWCMDHPGDLAEMRHAARQRAELFSWERFRAGIVRAVAGITSAPYSAPEVVAPHV